MAELSRERAVGVGGAAVTQRLVAGALAGLVGGLLFGMIMGMGGMLPMVAMLVGSKEPLVGFIVHMLIAAIIGLGFGAVFGANAVTESHGALWGVVYGLIWWVLGPLLIMPTMMGMGPQFGMAFTPPMLMSLVGHLIYGLATGLAYPALLRRLL
jgi:uncharacterized membrane protein YagU involved in acid resistance